ncbi:hypothetical protein B0I35DRAFT_483853 [Stachybotrys elegans]|uniref:Uncharacterized protein n=1 Tax=Stachybotrys elegans TaxID=80388 RepID=A0A8K0SJH0_9HYPO|nr:hypothetical protein B0I35DRAFT_483853 [Stachybotrys elegans]
MSGYSSTMLATIKLAECLDVKHPKLHVFYVHPGMVKAENGRSMVTESLMPFAKDKPALTRGLSVYLPTPKTDFFKGGYLDANWDVEELEKHKDRVVKKKLVRLGFLNGQLQPGGYPWLS